MMRYQEGERPVLDPQPETRMTLLIIIAFPPAFLSSTSAAEVSPQILGPVLKEKIYIMIMFSELKIEAHTLLFVYL